MRASTFSIAVHDPDRQEWGVAICTHAGIPRDDCCAHVSAYRGSLEADLTGFGQREIVRDRYRGWQGLLGQRSARGPEGVPGGGQFFATSEPRGVATK